MLASHALVLLGVPVRRVVHRVQAARDDRYESLRGYFHGASDTDGDDADSMQVRLHPVHVGERARANGMAIVELNLAALNVELISMRRAMQRLDFTPVTKIQSGDVLVLRGTQEALSLAEDRLLV